MVFEYMDHDLTGLSDRPGMRFSVPQIKVGLQSKEVAVPLYPFGFIDSVVVTVISDWFLYSYERYLLCAWGGNSVTWDNFWLASITAMLIKFSIVISKVCVRFRPFKFTSILSSQL